MVQNMLGCASEHELLETRVTVAAHDQKIASGLSSVRKQDFTHAGVAGGGVYSFGGDTVSRKA